MVAPRTTVLFAATLVVSACDLSEIVIAPMEPVTIVHSVLNTAADTQYVLIEESFNGSPVSSLYLDGRSFGYPVRTPAAKPISDATVTLTHLTPPPECTQPSVRLSELKLSDDLSGDTASTGVYSTDALCELRPGDRVELSIVTPDKRMTSGTTRVPGVHSVAVSTTGGGIAPDTLRLYRDTDTVYIAVEALFASAMQVEVVSVGNPLSINFPFSFVTDTLATAIAGDLILPFVGEDGYQLFQPGHYYGLTVAVTDTNYFDFARSGSDEFTARGFINHLEGGIGVFGSVHPHTTSLRVTGGRIDPREGLYRITGSYDGRPVDVSVDLFLDFSQPRPEADAWGAAIVDGTWVGEPIAATAEAVFGNDGFPYGSFPMTLQFAVGVGFEAVQYFVFGAPEPLGRPFSVEVRTPRPEDPIETLQMVHVCSTACEP